MAKNYDSLSMIKNSRFVKLFDCCDEKTKKAVLVKIDNLIKESSYTDEKNYGHLCNIFSSMAFYYIFQENGKSKKESLDVVQNAMYEFIEPQKKKLQKVAKLPGFIKLIKWSFPLKVAKTNGVGWDITYPKCQKDEYAFTTNKCIYAQIFSLYNVEELGPVFCHVDDILYGDLPGIAFEYTQTICRGGKFCDYIFRKKII
ncbi:MAG: L-2-amino-thiazoline-4-carboxylic acid hydrolase [Clostridiaceae bacterium]